MKREGRKSAKLSTSLVGRSLGKSGKRASVSYIEGSRQKTVKLSEVPFSQKVLSLPTEASAAFSQYLSSKTPNLLPLLKMLETIVHFFSFTSTSNVRFPRQASTQFSIRQSNRQPKAKLSSSDCRPIRR